LASAAPGGGHEQPLTQLLLRSALWGAAWGGGAGALEAIWHLHTWSLATTLAVATGFFGRALIYGIVFFGLWTPAVVAGSSLLGRRLPALIADSGRARILGALTFGTVALYGGVCWRVGHHINDSWKDPVLAGGMLAIVVVAAALGHGVAAVSGGLVRRFPRIGLVPIPVAVLLYAGVPLATSHESTAERPLRVMLITLDTFRADHLGAAGGRATPTLDGLAHRGVLFQQAVSQAPITCPAHLSILSGTPPSEHGVFANGTAIPTDLPLLQESFQAAGIPTAGFVAGYPVTSRFGFDRGFDVFDDDFGDALGDHQLAVRRLVDQAVYAVGAPRERRADAVLERAIPWLERHAAGGFFCWLHFFDPHGPYDAPAPFLGTLAGPMPEPSSGPEMPHFWPAAMRAVADPAYWILRYDEEIAYLDDRLGQLLSVLSEQGVLEDTLIAVIADHGESLDEHEYYFDHGLHLYDASLRIPMILAGPGVPAAEVPCQVRGMDLAPTVLDLLKLEVPESMQGEVLEPLWQHGCPDDPLRLSEAATVEPPWVEDPGAELSLRVDGTLHYKLIRHRRGDDELYELDSDPGETRDLVGQRAEVEEWMNRGLDRIAEGMPPVAPRLTADVEAQLRALGYITDGPRQDDPDEPADDDSAGAE